MIVVSDATPLRYLIEIQEPQLLKALFDKVLIPAGVSEELQHQRTPGQIKEWIQSTLSWLEVRQADVSLFQPRKAIGKGEHQAIALAIELKADAILMDDQCTGREACQSFYRFDAFNSGTSRSERLGGFAGSSGTAFNDTVLLVAGID